MKGESEMTGTKEKILLTALSLFAENGYEAVSVSDIAGQLGITKGALYRHFRNKQDIFDSIIAHMERLDAEHADDHDMPTGTLDEMEDAYRSVTIDHMIAFSRDMFRYWTEDAFAAPFRRLLTLEQFRNPEMSRLYQQYLASGPVDYMTDLFSSLGFSAPRQRAMEFYAPLYLLYSVYDGADDQKAVLSLANACLESTRKALEEESPKKA